MTAALLLCACRGPIAARITIDPGTTWQTMSGWEATAQAGHERSDYARFSAQLVDLAVDSLGLNRIRVEVRSGSENTIDYREAPRDGNGRCRRYEAVNDNDDPRLIDSAGFHFSELDREIADLVLPLQRAMQARGRRLIVSVNYIAFVNQCRGRYRYDHQTPDEYAEFALATVLHLRDRFALVPDLWEVVLEPDYTPFWRGRQIGEAIVATAHRFRENGFDIRFVGPSNTSTATAIRDYDAMVRVPGAKAELAEMAYHRYRAVSHDALREIGRRAARDTIRTAMLEHIGSGIDDLFDDLTLARVSAWQQYALAYPGGPDNASLYLDVDTRDSARPVRLSRSARLLAQVFRYVQPGAVRLGSSSDRHAARVVAFRNPDGRHAVIVRAKRPASLELGGLPAGRYGITWSTESTTQSLPDTTIATGGTIVTALPSAGALTVFGR